MTASERQTDRQTDSYRRRKSWGGGGGKDTDRDREGGGAERERERRGGRGVGGDRENVAQQNIANKAGCKKSIFFNEVF